MTSVDRVDRVRPPETASERATLEGLLDFLRATVVNKVAGLTDAQAFASPVPPSTLTPAGLVKHLTGVERFWFSIDFAGADLPVAMDRRGPARQLSLAEGDTLASLVEAYITECARSRVAIADADLDDLARRRRPVRAAAGPPS